MDLYEQKYNDALERMKSWANGEHPECFSEAQKAAEFIFPELAENGDEKIRKEIMQLIQCMHDADPRKERWIAWLEKQKKPEDMGEISDGYHTFNELYRYRMLYNAAFVNLLPKELVYKSKRHHDGKECFGGGWFIVMVNLPTGQISNHYELKDWDLFQIPEKDVADEWDGHTPQEAADRLHRYLLERQREQPTDKIEPKFKVRDWIVINATTYQITEIDNSHVVLSLNGRECNFRLNVLNLNNAHLWTINDAKDGDVLVTEDYIFIFKYILHGGVHLYCHYNFDDEEFDSDIPDAVIGNIHDKGIHFRPATKEQRDLLFEKMKEAGYEWSDEKKEVKKIEPKIIDSDVLQELNKLKEEIKELKEEIKNLNNRRRWK